jgi:methylated-DNA-[protein]-cysteine S-methyltransferase
VHSAHLPDTPAGPVTVWVSGTGLRRIEFGPLPEHAHTDPPEAWPELLEIAVTQLREYFARERNIFDLPLDLDAVTDFQRSVYDELLKVGYGRLTTYGDLANSVRRPELARAVGQAVGANPIPIVIPCHRVVAADGRLGGFSGGLGAKVALLAVERVHVDGVSETSRVHPEELRLDL